MNGLLIGLFAVAALVIALGGILAERGQRAEVVTRAEDDMGDLSRLFAQHAETKLLIADTLLTGFRQLIETSATSAQSLQQIDTMLQAIGNAGDLHSLGVIDSEGAWRAGFGPHTETVADAPHFRAQAASTGRDLVIATPELDPASGRLVIPLSRRLEDSAGNFGGIVVAYIEPRRFADFYRSALGDNTGRAATLLSTDTGVLLARDPETAADVAPTLGLPGESGRGTTTVLRHVTGSDGIVRAVTLSQGQRLPIAVLVAQSDQDIAAIWWRQALLHGTATLIFAGLFLAAGLYALVRFRQLQRLDNERLLVESEFRVLVEGAGDTVLRLRLDGRISYAAPISAAVLGHGPDALIGNRLTDLVATENEPAVIAAIQGAASGAHTRVSFFLAASTDCVPRRIIATLRLVTGINNWSIVAVLRDETEGYRTERALASMASTDALTGLANRRTFMERLNREWRRANREGQPLSLLFVDADNFKPFNDKYGHVAGDRCLKEIGAVIAGSSRRPGDVVARYGGEEFVLLLPRTDAAGGRHVAELLRKAIADLAIPHAGNGPGVVTASIGVATEIPGHDDSGPEALLANADGALYQAKASGRNVVQVYVPDETPAAPTQPSATAPTAEVRTA